MTVFPGRYTAVADEPFVVFIIGMRVNRWWALHKWVPTALAMGPMLRTLYTHQQEKGFLSAQTFLYGRGVALVQYWRSFEDLERFARSKDDPHLKAWQRFNRAIGGDGSVGIFHETYTIQPGAYEAIYGNMPVFGLASAFEHTKIVGRRDTARGRLGIEPQPTTPRTEKHTLERAAERSAAQAEA
ncbi:MAG TPA: DUF4188 domain-containing protein [Ktedonobacterales bacterium]|jgi:hypothetical protein|nr:DUF4188 domain-containing protein [Ktedonobacterales bacterium]